MRRFRRAVPHPIPLLLLSLLAMACFGSTEVERDPARALLTEAGKEPAEGCIVSERPARLPEVGDVVRLRPLSDSLRELSRSHRIDTAHAIASLQYAADGFNTRHDVIEHSFPDSVVESVRRNLASEVREFGREDPPVVDDGDPGREGDHGVAAEFDSASDFYEGFEWGVRLRIDAGTERSGENGPRFRIGRQEYCPPRPRDRTLENALEGIVTAGPRYRDGRRERVIIMEAAVHPNGYVTDARIVQGAGGGSELERRLKDHVRQYSFFPATLDGRPTHGSIELPVTVRDS